MLYTLIQVYFTLKFFTKYMMILKISINNWRMVVANLHHVVRKENVEQLEWYKKSKEVKESKKIMIKNTEYFQYMRPTKELFLSSY